MMTSSRGIVRPSFNCPVVARALRFSADAVWSRGLRGVPLFQWACAEAENNLKSLNPESSDCLQTASRFPAGTWVSRYLGTYLYKHTRHLHADVESLLEDCHHINPARSSTRYLPYSS